MEVTNLIQTHLRYLKNLDFEEVPQSPPLKKLLTIIEEAPFETLQELREKVLACSLCNSAGKRQRPIFGEGDQTAKVIIVLDYPRHDEDLQGLVITGHLRNILFRLLQTLSPNLKEFFLTLAVKCSPLGGKPPEDERVEACKPYLFKQISLIKPKAVLCFGSTPTKLFFGEKEKVTLNEARRKPLKYENSSVFFTYHPDDILKNPQIRRLLWEDLQKVKASL